MQEQEIQIINNVWRPIVTKILYPFVDQAKDSTSTNSFYRHLDIELSRYDEFSYIQITNCNRSEGNIAMIGQLCFEKYIQEILFYINFGPYKKKIVYESRVVGDSCDIFAVMMARQSKHLAHLEKYFSVRFKCTLSPSNNEIFKESIIEILKDLEMWYPNIKWTFHSNKEIYWRNQIGLDKPIENCMFVSSAITTMVRQTRDKRFQERCLALLNIDKASKIKDALVDKFITMIHDRHANKMNNRLTNYGLRKKSIKRN